MNRHEHLLTILAEECAEVAQRASKALRFGMEEIQKDQPLTNAQRITQEFTDLVAVYGMLDLPAPLPCDIVAKQERVEKYLKYSHEQGTLTNDITGNNDPA